MKAKPPQPGSLVRLVRRIRYIIKSLHRPHGMNHYCPGESGSGEWSCRSDVPSICHYCREPNEALRRQNAEVEVVGVISVQDLVNQLVAEGGAIVSSDECSTMEIGVARSVGRFAVDSDGMGFVRRPKQWLAINKRREELHPNTDGRYSSNSVLNEPGLDK